MMRCRIRTSLALGLALAASGCGVGAERPPAPDPNSVVFVIEPVDAARAGRLGWRAAYRTAEATARFRIELMPERRGVALPAFTRCSLVRETPSDGSTLLRDLARALAGQVPAPGLGVEGFDLPAVLLGRDLSRGGAGNQIAGWLGSEPKGSWVATKLFMGEGEVFLHLDPVGGYGAFSIKDPDYGPAVLREFGRLFQGEPSEGFVEGDAAPEAAVEASADPVATPDPDAKRVAGLVEQAAPGVPQPKRRKALETLAALGPRARAAVPTFVEALADDDGIIRGEALRGLPKLRPDPQLGITAVTPLLQDPSAMNQAWAAGALAEFGDVSTAVTHLTVGLAGDARTFAAAGLMRIGPGARSAVPMLITMLTGRRSPSDGYAACRALAAIGRDASPALPALREASTDADKHVRDAALYAIREIEGR